MRWLTLSVLSLAVAPLLMAQPPEPPNVRPGPPGSFGPPPSPGTFQPASQRFKDLIPGLVDALKDTDMEVRQHAALALASLGQEAIAPLTKALEDPVRDKRAAAAYALGQMGYNAQEAVPALLKTLKDDEATVRRAAAQALNRVVSSEMFATGRGMPGMAPFGGGGGFGGGGRFGGSAPPLLLPEAAPKLESTPKEKPKTTESPKAPDKSDNK